MHAEALDSQNTSTLLRTFWTALENLFSAPAATNKNRENVINSIIAIIQKTYILKLLRELYSQLNSAISAETMVALGINTFELFVEYFSKYDAGSAQMKIVYAQLSNNPLLRSRLFNTREKLKSGASIQELLNAHKTKITWQLKRLLSFILLFCMLYFDITQCYPCPTPSRTRHMLRGSRRSTASSSTAPV